jgi:sigma-B regulation protein RsbU (phosphoserine phosphatase)
MSYQLFLATVSLTVGGLIILLGLIILRESPRQRLNRVTSVMLFFAGLGAILGGLGFLLAGTRPGGSVLSVNLLQNFAYTWEFFFPTLLLFAALYPTTLPLLRRWPHSWLLIFVPHGVHVVVVLSESVLGPNFGLQAVRSEASYFSSLVKLARVTLSLAYRTHRSLFSFVNLAYVIASLVLFARSYRRALGPKIRQQLRVIFAGMGVCVVLYSASFPIPTILGADLPGALSTTLLVSALVLGCGSIAYAIVRHRFLDTKLIVRRSILYALATALVVGVYLLVVRRFDRFLASASGLDVVLLDTVFLVLALIIYQPILAKTEEILERMFMRDRTDYRNVVLHLSEEVTSMLDVAALGEGLCRTLTESMVVNGAALVVAEGPGYRLEAAHEVPATEALRAGLPFLRRFPPEAPMLAFEEIHDALGDGAGARLASPLHDAGIRLILPLRHRGECMGFLLLGDKAAGTRFTTEDLSLLRTLANQVAVGVRNASLYRTALEKSRLEEDLEIARRIQRSYLPAEFPVRADFDIHGTNVPSKQVGGDYYDVIPMARERFFVAMADVSGKGVPASLLSAMLHASLHAYVAEGYGVAEIQSRVNRRVHESTSADQFITGFLGLFEPESRIVRYSNAGHNPPFLIRSDGTSEALSAGGLILGVDPDAAYEEVRVDMNAGDRLILYTDGITEALRCDGEQFGEERLLALVRGLPPRMPSEAIVREIIGAVERFADADEASDDRTLLVVRAL